MSKKWTTELDSILIHGVFEECQISFGKALCEKIAQRVRAAGIEGFTECTPKAVENRLYSWKKKNLPSTAATTSGDAAAPAVPATPKKPTAGAKKIATPKTPRVKKGAKKEVSEEENGGAEAEAADVVAGKKRAAEGEESSGKKVKVEADEDEGLGVGDTEGEEV